MKISRSDILYAPVSLLLHGMALLPMWVLYGLSDVLFVLIRYVVRYRVKVVRRNIGESFPEMSVAECRRTERRFYRHFADYFVETIKLLHISDAKVRQMMEFVNVEEVDRSVAAGRSVAVYAGHYANWEYLSSITLWSRFSTDEVAFGQIYRRLNNEWFDAFFLRLRSRFNSSSYEKRESFRDLLRLKRSGKVAVTGFISDQHPSGVDTHHVVRFLNHDTAMISGTETIIRKLDYDVFYFDTETLGRGRYRTTMRKITTNQRVQPPRAITDAYVALLESSIRRQPELWLWTHKRWKHKCTECAQPLTPLSDD